MTRVTFSMPRVVAPSERPNRAIADLIEVVVSASNSSNSEIDFRKIVTEALREAYFRRYPPIGVWVDIQQAPLDGSPCVVGWRDHRGNWTYTIAGWLQVRGTFFGWIDGASEILRPSRPEVIRPTHFMKVGEPA